MPIQSNRFLSIDPSLRNMGWVARSGDALLGMGLIRGPREGEWVERIAQLKDAVLKAFNQYACCYVVIELPQKFSGARHDVGVNSEAVQKLYFLVGYITALFHGAQIPIFHVRPSQWKGGVSKKITQHRVKRRHGIHVSNHNIADAIGISDWWVERGCQQYGY